MDIEITEEPYEENIRKVFSRVLKLINFLLLVSGIGMLTCGILFHQDMFQVEQFVGPITYKANILMCFSGTLVIAFGCLGFWTWLFTQRIMLCLLTYAIFSVFYMQMVVSAVSFARMSDVTYVVSHKLTKYIETGYLESKRASESYKALDYVQTRFQCCGSYNYTDWNHSEWISEQNETNFYVPSSCCKTALNVPGCNVLKGEKSNLHNINRKGCSIPVSERYMSNLLITGVVATFISLIQLICFLLSNFLMSHSE